MNRQFNIIICILICSLFCQQTIAGKAKVFSHLNLKRAMTKSVAENKLLVIDFTAKWCGPCRRMEQTTWVDPVTINWFANNAVAIQVDIDRQRDLASEFNVRAIPTFIVFRNGKLAKRMSGGLSTEQLIQWLESIQGNNNRSENQPANTTSNADAGEVINQYLTDIDALAEEGEHLKATEQYLSLWQEIFDKQPRQLPKYSGRFSSALIELAAADDEAKQQIIEMRNGIAEHVKTNKPTDRTWDYLELWVHLNKSLNENEITAAWFSEVKWNKAFSPGVDRIRGEIEIALMETEQWSEIALLHPYPMRQIREVIAKNKLSSLAKHPETERERVREEMSHAIRSVAIQIYPVYLAANKESLASRVALLAINRLDEDEIRRQLVSVAVYYPKPSAREIHLQWLDEIEQPNEEDSALREKVETLLNTQG